MGNNTQAKIKAALIQVFDELSADHQMEVLEFALLIGAKEGRPLPQLDAEFGSSASRSKPDTDSLQGSVLHYDDPFEPVGVEDWEVLQ